MTYMKCQFLNPSSIFFFYQYRVDLLFGLILLFTAFINSVNYYLNPSFPMHPFLPLENIRKPYGYLMFAGGRERVH